MKCPDCDGKITFSQTNCPDCGRSLGDLDLVKLKGDSDKKKKKILASVVVVTLLMSGGVATKTYLDNQRDKRIALEQARKAAEELRLAREAEEAERKRIQAERDDYSWVPDGFSKFAVNYNMAYKTIGYDAADCFSNCWGFVAISKDYCSTIQINANIQRGGVILDTDSDFASGVPAGTRVVMKITSSASLPWTAYVTKATCT
jgi:hypothetical protein